VHQKEATRDEVPESLFVRASPGMLRVVQHSAISCTMRLSTSSPRVAALERTGETCSFPGIRDPPPADQQASLARRLEDTVVLLSGEGEIVTVYCHRKARPSIRRKRKDRPGLPARRL
jgi:hypothetical protein